jgi:hypothetical protein
MKIENNIQGIVNGNGIKSLLSETLPDGSGTFFRFADPGSGAFMIAGSGIAFFGCRIRNPYF